jgi:hypothetical protein
MTLAQKVFDHITFRSNNPLAEKNGEFFKRQSRENQNFDQKVVSAGK